MLPTPPQQEPAAFGVQKEKSGDTTEFHNWAGRGAARLILPEIKESPLVSRVKALKAKVEALESKVADSECQNAELNQKVTDSDHRIAYLEQKVFKEDWQIPNAFLAIQVNKISYIFLTI